MKPFINIVFLIFLGLNLSLYGQLNSKRIIPGAERLVLLRPAIKNRSIAVVANHTSLVGKTHLVDTLLSIGANVKKIFCPEHGFRGEISDGENVINSKDAQTGLPIISLYGNKNKPSTEDLKGIDMVIYDLQDVGVRCYTYISTLTYVMQACAENFIPIFILDRPNPNGFYIDGPVLDLKFKSFVGMLPIPVVYGMTSGELATMINEEGWLGTSEKCGLAVIPCQNYSHKSIYNLPVNPSPNLPNMRAVYLYPSLFLFEATKINVGRGTDFPFQVFGSPLLDSCNITYTPKSIPKRSKNPPHMGKLCKGFDLQNLTLDELINRKQICLDYLILAYSKFPDKKSFFSSNGFFSKLAGTDLLQKQIIKKTSVSEIRLSWQTGIDKFKIIRKKYLIYEDFE